MKWSRQWQRFPDVICIEIIENEWYLRLVSSEYLLLLFIIPLVYFIIKFYGIYLLFH
jgi:hypothetical protein